MQHRSVRCGPDRPIREPARHAPHSPQKPGLSERRPSLELRRDQRTATGLIQFGRNLNIDLDEKFHGRERSNRFQPPPTTAFAVPDRKGT